MRPTLIAGRRLPPAVAGLALAASAIIAPHATAGAVPEERPVVVKDVRIPPVPLGDLQRSITDDRGILLGGVGSGLFPAARRGDYWMVTDRGPAWQVTAGTGERRTFPIPELSPAIVQVATRFGVEIKKYLPLTGASGEPVTGLSNLPGRDEPPYTWDGRRALPYDPGGVDPEDVVRTSRGEFWLADEYGPSLLHVSGQGRVLARHVPKGLDLPGAGYPVKRTLPAILASRVRNRGFEGLAIGGGTLYLAMQSPLANPDARTAASSRLGRLLTFDLRAQRVTGEYAYRFEDVRHFDPAANGDQSEMKISGLAHVSGRRLLVAERTDRVARIYRIDLAGAANLLGGRYDDPATTPSLEASALPPAVRLPAKSLVADLSAVAPTLPGKVEGLALLDRRTLAVANDNDFGVAGFGADGRVVSSGVPSRIVTIRLPRPLP
ncbi:esterase-like activity of phytase family protein [Nonomuraea rubra]